MFFGKKLLKITELEEEKFRVGHTGGGGGDSGTAVFLWLSPLATTASLVALLLLAGH